MPTKWTSVHVALCVVRMAMDGSVSAAELHRFAARERVAAFVARVAAVALDPVVADGVRARERVELLPEVAVEYGGAVGLLPAAPLPARDPFRQAVLEVLAVRVERDARAGGREGERLDGGGELHAVVGRLGMAAALFRERARALVAGDDGPAAGATGIFEAAAVGVDGVIDGR